MINAITIQGRLFKDADYHLTPEGLPVSNFNIVCHEPDPQTRPLKTRTLNMRVNAFGYLAETTQNLKQGDVVVVLGRLKENNFTDRRGIERREYAVYAHECHLVMSARRLAPGAAAPLVHPPRAATTTS